MLMKPMQRITRYPLLLKRLLSNISLPHLVDQLKTIIADLEKRLQLINAFVKRKEAAFRMQQIDETIDFGMIVEVLRI